MTYKTPNHDLSPMRCPERLEDVDLFSTGAAEHWYEAYEILHREAPVLKIPGEGLGPGSDGYILSCYEDVSRVVKDPIRFPPTLSLMIERMLASGRSVAEMPNANAMMISMMTLRPSIALWRAHRQELTDPWVGPGADRHTAMIEAHVDALLDGWIERGFVEFVAEFARPLPQRVMASVLGFPLSDLKRLEAWGNAQVKAFVHGRGHRNQLSAAELEAQVAELAGFSDYVQQQVEEKRARPQDDMISFLTAVEYQALGRKLTDMEINGVVYAMVIGGLETTQYALAEGAALLCEREGVLEAIRHDRSKIRQFIEECLRLRSPTQGLSTRTTSREEVFQGVTVPAGSLLHLRWAAANVDEQEFQCPHDLDLERRAASRHVAFSAGPRVCPGAGISRLEQSIAWNRLLDRIEHLEYGDGNDFLHQPGIMLGTLKLDLKFRKA